MAIEESRVLESDLLIDISGSVATLTFNRPDKANAFHPDIFGRVLAFFQSVEQNDAVRVVLIQANGKHFMAGGDLSTLPGLIALPPDRRYAALEQPIHEYNVVVRTMRRLGKPIVAKIQGAVAGAAVGFILACDVTVAADTSYFWAAHILHGGSNDGLLSYFLPRAIGARKAFELALLGERLTARQAQDLGMINFVVPENELESAAINLVDRLAHGPTAGYALIKNLFNRSLSNSLEEQGALEAESYAKSGMTADWEEGIHAFFEKRQPQFKGN
jgi:2-(1,2-epoxy-1,2-dihydrophenyl)acetyl-CoA isomerase